MRTTGLSGGSIALVASMMGAITFGCIWQALLVAAPTTQRSEDAQIEVTLPEAPYYT
jgi:hypothetical protein